MQLLKRKDLFKQEVFIDGKWCSADKNEEIIVTNPATGEVLGLVPNFGVEETRLAINAADKALVSWREVPAKRRSQILRRWFDLMLKHKDDLARIMTLEQGKPFNESLGEINYAASYLDWYSEEAKRIYGDVIPGPASDRRIVVVKDPIGVCAAITPWNFPAAMITRKVGAALAAGCTMVLKPASQTPFSAFALAVLAEEAGVPAAFFLSLLVLHQR